MGPLQALSPPVRLAGDHPPRVPPGPADLLSLMSTASSLGALSPRPLSPYRAILPWSLRQLVASDLSFPTDAAEVTNLKSAPLLFPV